MKSPSAHPWFDRFWAVAGAVSVRTKILGMVLGLVLLLGLAVTLQVRATLERTLDVQLEGQAVSVARDLAARSTDLILINDLFGLQQLLQDTQGNNANVRYVFVVSSDGYVLAHTFGEGFPSGLLEANGSGPDEHHRTVILTTDEGHIWDTAVPIFGGRSGTARVGLSDSGVRQAVRSVTGQLLLTTGAVSGVAIAAAALLTWILTRPILNLSRAAQAVGRGDLTPRLRRWADDEIGELAEAFNGMTEALARAAAERREREQLRAQYVQSVISAQEEERKRIARELHDSTGQSLTSLLVGLRALDDESASTEIHRRSEELCQVAADALEEVRTLALQLRPSVLDDLGLPAALERHVAECRRRYGLRIDLVIHGLGEGRLPPPTETALYRIVQEAITNVGRHAQASTASVLLERRNRSVRLIVEDDGKGFDPAATGGSERRLGLYGMRERAELLGGTLMIESEQGAGTSLFVTIPLESQGRPGG